MQKLLKGLKAYESEKVTFSIYELSQILKDTNCNSITSVIQAFIKEKMNVDIDKNEKFDIFYFVKNKEYPIEVKREVFNNFRAKLFSNPDLKFLKERITKLQDSPNIKIKDYTIDIYIFMKKPNYKLIRFNKLFLQIKEKLTVNEEFDKQYFPSFFESIAAFFIDIYSLISKRISWIVATFSIYIIYYYKMMLETIGFTDDIIDITYILSILKLFTTVVLPILMVIS